MRINRFRPPSAAKGKGEMPVVGVALRFQVEENVFDLKIEVERFESFSADAFVDAEFCVNGAVTERGREALVAWEQATGCSVKL